MSNRKGELSHAAVDREWPHQVALPAGFVTGSKHEIIERIKADLGGCSRGHSVRHNDTSYVVFCFADSSKANIFRELFHGEPFDPKDRGRGSRWWEWRKPARRQTPQAIRHQVRRQLDEARSLAYTAGLRPLAQAIELAIDETRISNDAT
jgi:hypothetical protein